MSYRNSLREDYDFLVLKNPNGGYEVSLPHQCDDWKILGFDAFEPDQAETEPVEGTYPAHPTNKAFAVSQMELFVRRAQEALEKLKQLD